MLFSNWLCMQLVWQLNSRVQPDEGFPAESAVVNSNTGIQLHSVVGYTSENVWNGVFTTPTPSHRWRTE